MKFKSISILFILIGFVQICTALNPEHVRLQLKWQNQFQFAGYYAAKSKGYYKNAGIDVEIIPEKPGEDPIQQVVSGKAEFGVGATDLLLKREQKMPVVVLACIFQHTPMVLICLKKEDIQTVHDLINKPIMLDSGSAELIAYLNYEGLDITKLQLITHSINLQDLISGKVSAYSAYITNEPYQLEKLGIRYKIFSPISDGIDFYSDNLFTTESLIKSKPELVKKFREASLKGWEYAMHHRDEIEKLIINQYNYKQSLDHLRFEAEQMLPLIDESMVEIGHMNHNRWERIVKTYQDLGMLKPDFNLNNFIYEPIPVQPDLTYLYLIISAIVISLIVATLVAVRYLHMSNELKKSIAEQKQTKLALDESDKTFRLLFDTSPYAIIITNLKGDFINANNKTFEIYKAKSKSEFLQYKASQFYANINERQQVIDEIVTKGYIENKEIKFRTLANEIKTFLVSAYTMPSATGEILIVSWQNDITEFKTVQKELEESEAKYKMLTDYSGDIIVMYRNFEKYYVNPSVEKILGYTQNECMNINFVDIVHPEYIEKINKYLVRESIYFIEKTYNEDLKIKHKDGHYISISAQIIFHIIDENNNIIIFDLRDITYKETSEKEIRRLSTAINQSPTTIVITNLNGDIEYVNPQFSVITGYTAEEALGNNPRILKSYFHSADFYENMWSTLLSGKTWKGEVYNKRKDGSFYWEEATIAPIFNEKNEIVNYVAIKQDVSLRKEAELKVQQQNDQLQELNKTKDKFISILAHDLKNPFNAILGYAELITNNFDEYSKDELKEYINIISISAKNTYNFLENLLEWAFSQQNKVKLSRKKTNLYKLTSECLNIVKSSALAKKIAIKIQIDEKTEIFADKEMIKTVIRNLLTNAIKFTSYNGSVIVKTKQNNDNIEIAITDTGIGMDENTRNSLFKIGETKSAIGTNGERGTGFGLMICKEFIEKHGGNIWVESQIGQGSNFYFTIPI